MIFQDNRELSRQGKYIAPEKVTGARKALLSGLGYKDTGESNTWGKVMNFLPILDTPRNMAAGGISKGTDTNTVIKSQRDEAFANDMNSLALGVEAAKMISGFGGFGGGGGGATGALSSFATGGMGEAATAGASAGGMNAVSTLDSLKSSAAIDDAKMALNKDLETVDTSGLTDYSKYVSMPENQGGTQTAGAGSGLIGDAFSGTGKGNGEMLNKVNKGLSKLPLVGGTVNALTKNIISAIALNKAGTEAWNEQKRNSVQQTNFNLL